MKITRSDSEKLVIVEFPYFLSAFYFLMAFAWLAYLVLWRSGESRNDLIGQYITIGLLFVGSAWVAKRSTFEFDRRLRQLKWSRVGLFGRTGATIPFEQIKGTKIDSEPDDGSITYWVTLMTKQKDIPLAKRANYGGFSGCTAMCNTINRAVGLPELPEDKTGADAIRALIANGQKIQAIKLTRELRHCGLAEAKGIVEAMVK